LINGSDLRIGRELLKDQAVVVLRDAIIGGRIPPGSKLVERDAAQMLGTSRVPARDALLALEREGLLVNRGGTRYVIDVSERDLKDLYSVRYSLEALAGELACLRLTESSDRLGECSGLVDQLHRMQKAIQNRDQVEYRKSDFQFHRALWVLSDNQLLVRLLESAMGSIYMMIVYNSRTVENWQQTVESHRAIADAICQADQERAVRNIRKHLDDVFAHLIDNRR